jgi:hypothetical protein|tara:strand:- start:471 stop:635 length:165 start_codon:yes stop_codon:yes gene_type:complete
MEQKKEELASKLAKAKARCQKLQENTENKQAKILEFMKSYISIRKLVSRNLETA